MSKRGVMIGRVIAVNLGLLALGLLVVELVFGAWFSAVGFSPVRVTRDVRIVFDARAYYPEGGSFEYRRDQHGLRGQYANVGAIDILAIGGSTTNELYVGEGRTWTDVLAATFRANGRAVDVANAGIDGQSTLGHIRNFDDWFPTIPGLKARYVLAYIGINDVHVEGQSQYDSVAPLTSSSRLHRWVSDRSALYRLQRTIKGALNARQARVLHAETDWSKLSWQEAPLPDTDADSAADTDRAAIDAYGKRVKALIDRIRAFGAQPIIVTQHRGTYRRDNDRLWVLKTVGVADLVTQSRFNRRAMEVCRDEAAICIDLGAEIAFQPGDFQDFVHTTPSGSRRVGEYLYARLKDQIR